MSRILKGVLITFIALMLISSIATAQEVFVVDDDGNPATTYQTLKAAILTAESFAGGPHMIVINEGTYSGAGLVISNTAKIASIKGRDGADPADIVFQAATYQTVNFLDISGTTNLLISGFTVLDYDTAFVGHGVDGVQMTYLRLGNNGVDGYVGGNDESGGGIALFDCDDGFFDNLYIFDGERGIRLADDAADPSDGNTISNNVVENNEQYGIYIKNGSNNIIDGNTVTASEDFGIQIRGAGNGNTISNNMVTNCLWEGITVSGPTGSTISGNTVFGCAYNPINPSGANNHTGISYAGIDIEGVATSATIFENNCYENGDGVTGFGLNVDGFWCNIYDNCFWGHPGTQAVDNATGGVNWWHNNYYSDMAFGATSYSLGVATDLSPAMRMINPEASATDIEVYSNQVVDFNLYLPGVCDTTDAVGMALYEFTVSWDTTKLEYISVGSGNDEFLGVAGDALYIVTGGQSTGSVTFSGTNFDAPNFGEGLLASIEFKGIGTGSSNVTIGTTTYRDGDNNDIVIGSATLTLNVQDTEAPTITVVANDPIGDDTYSDGYGNVKLYVEGAVTDNYALNSVWYRYDNTGSWNFITAVTGKTDTYGALPGDYYLDITGLTQGAHNVNVIVVDQSGNRDSVYYDFNIDRTGPDVANLTLADADGCAQAGYTSSLIVDVAWDNPDGSAVQHEFYYSGTWHGVLPIENPTTYTLNAVEGVHQLWVRQYDVYGNMGPQIGPVAITLDQTAPVPSALVLDGGALKTNTTSINADASQDVPGGATHIAWSETVGDLTCDGATWIAAPIHPFAVTLSAGDGVKTVYMVSRDAAGNVSAPISDDIELDTEAPVLTVFDIQPVCSSSKTVTINIEWTGTDAKWIHIYETNIATPTKTASVDISALTSPATVTFKVSDGEGNYDLFGLLEDDIGNVQDDGDALTDNFFYDAVNPTVTAITLLDTDYDGSLFPHAQWTNDATVDVEITGLSADVVTLEFSETGAFGGEETQMTVSSPGDPFNTTYTFSAPTECAVNTLYVRAVDCANRLSAAVFDGITYDVTLPVITDFMVTSADPTNVLSANVSMTLTDNCNAWKMRVYEDGYVGSAVWVDDAATATVTLANDGDGVRTLKIDFIDPTGSMVSASTTVEVDQTAPSGTAVLQQFGNPLAIAGYTNSLTNNEVVNITWDADALQMAIRNNDGSSNTGWMALTNSYNPWTLIAGGSGTRTIEIIFKDNAGNVGSWIPISIMYLDGTSLMSPTAGTAFGVPGASVTMDWAPVVNGQYYYVKYNFTGKYPTFDDGIPPHPGALGDTTEGIFAAMVPDTHFVFSAPHADIYSFSIWTIDLAGNISLLPNMDVVETDYILGDMDLDGAIEFVDDFGTFASVYSLTTASTSFLADADFGPTNDGSGTGYPIPDGAINVEDLAIMGLNYNAANSKKSPQDFMGKAAPSMVAVDATISKLGQEYVVSITANHVEDIMLYYLDLGLNNDDVEIISATRGEGFSNTSTSWFHHNNNSSNIELTGIVLGDDQFTSNELARVIVRSEYIDDFKLEEINIIVRDRANNDINVEFNVVNKIEILPNEFALRQNYPNPFNPSTTIELSLPVATQYSLKIFNITGQLVETFDGYSEAGIHHIEWDASNNSSGIYFYRLETSAFSDTKKMILLK